MWHVWRTGLLVPSIRATCPAKHPGFWLEDPREGDQFEDLIVYVIILKINLAKNGMRRRGLDS